ncbi:hypothetical protein [Chryseobacterium potabilaquae]|uniref:Uncharacterized protein n=1 Tax=Chryseobacterium potabilaquae TaxID=2675057 RepID=A0A6N4X7N7_9FLAO|nr:hypothetical protein [Chryseobacterium potabilaquae]CAA7196738.1 hypothetical protein CHRY9293_02813 [Chryseobacterium potabilaquae]
MRLYSSINSFCDSYAIPISESTIGYLQFFSELVIPNSTDVVTLKCYVVDAIAMNEVLATPLNSIVQYLGDDTFRMLIQGFHDIPESFRFRFKIVITTDSNSAIVYSDLFSFEKCVVSYPIIPCLAEGQQYSGSGAFLGEITGSIVYQSWHTHEPKKYTPVVFLRNLSFNKKTSTIEYKKLNNKPLKSTLKKNFNLICEPVSSMYSEYVMDIFGFGKINLLTKTYAFDTYSDEILDEKDCYSLYKISATAYQETQLRLQCSNQCVVLDPITCEDLVSPDENIIVQVSPDDFVIGHTLDITQQILNSTGFDISELDFLNGIRNDCWIIVYDGSYIMLRYDPVNPNGSCEELAFNYSICGVMISVIIKMVTQELPCIASTLTSITYSGIDPMGYTIIGEFNTEVRLQYSIDHANWIDAGIFPIGTEIFTNSLPVDSQLYVRVISTCEEGLISNVIEYQSFIIDYRSDFVSTIYKADSGSHYVGQLKFNNLQIHTVDLSDIVKVEVRCRFRAIGENIWFDQTETYDIPIPSPSLSLSHQFIYGFKDPSKYIGTRDWNGADNFFHEIKIYTSLGNYIAFPPATANQMWYGDYPDAIT